MAKSFKDLDLDINNPTATILSEDKKPVEKKTSTPKPKKEKTTVKVFKPTVKEKKTKRLLVLLKPSVFEKVEASAKASGISTNEYINQVLETVVK